MICPHMAEGVIWKLGCSWKLTFLIYFSDGYHPLGLVPWQQFPWNLLWWDREYQVEEPSVGTLTTNQVLPGRVPPGRLGTRLDNEQCGVKEVHLGGSVERKPGSSFGCGQCKVPVAEEVWLAKATLSSQVIWPQPCQRVTLLFLLCFL